jgi:hypothetical protein
MGDPETQVNFVLVVKESPAALGSIVIPPKKRPLPGSLPRRTFGNVFERLFSRSRTLGRPGSGISSFARMIEGREPHCGKERYVHVLEILPIRWCSVPREWFGECMAGGAGMAYLGAGNFFVNDAMFCKVSDLRVFFRS